MTTPNPGSDEAIKKGCVCAVMDNRHGAGCGRSDNGRPLYWITEDCPVHGDKNTDTSEEVSVDHIADPGKGMT